MNKSYWVAGSLGGLTVFAWSMASLWLGLHGWSMLTFSDEAPVTAAIAANAPVSGVYVLPSVRVSSDATPEQARLRREAATKQWETGPTAIIAVRVQGLASLWSNIFKHLVIQLVAGLLVAWLLSKTTGLTRWDKVGFVVAVAFTAGVIAHLPELNWLGFSGAYTFVNFFNLIVGWTLGGIVISKRC
jgi:hypothetical protein